jgi:uncharacterized protein (DUF2252 family)
VKQEATEASPAADERAEMLERIRLRKMARSSHAYVRGSTVQFYEALAALGGDQLPDGPPVWICGDCHVGNLGPVADASGRLRIQIRDLDQTVIGNPAHDLVRLALSLASAARGSNLPGVTTARMLEAIMDGYESAFDHDFDEAASGIEQPASVRFVMRKASKRTWKHLARERIGDTRPNIPLGKRFWRTSADERAAITSLFADHTIARLATMLRSREDDATVEVVDAAYWMKGCSSLGKLRFAVLLSVSSKGSGNGDLCLMDVKEAVPAAAPASPEARMPDDDATRVLEGARSLSPFLGERMRAAHVLERPVFIRELLPQDLKLEIERLSEKEATKAARFLASVVGFAHVRQMDSATRSAWRVELGKNRSKSLDAPSWLWSSVVELLVNHEGEYLEHCRRYAIDTTG